MMYIKVLTEYVPVHDKTSNKTCASSEDSDQPIHTQYDKDHAYPTLNSPETIEDPCDQRRL